MIESPKDFNACGYAKECNHQVKYDMNARDNCYYQQGREDVCNTLTDLCTRWVDDDGICWNTDCPFCDDVCKIEQLKEQGNDN